MGTLRDVARWVYPAAAVILIAGSAATWVNFAMLRSAERANTHVHEVISALHRTQALLADAESGQRGFILTRRPAFLDPYDGALAHLPGALERLETLVAEEPEQRARLHQLRRLADAHIAFLAHSINDELNGYHARALQAVSSQQADRGMAGVRAQVIVMINAQARLLRKQLAADTRATRATLTVTGSMMLLAITLLVRLRHVVRRDAQILRQRDSTLSQREHQLATLNASLERRVEQRTRELQEANAELETFAYAIAHDLRAPLRNLQGLADALREDCHLQLDATARDYLDRIARTANRMDVLILDLLAYAQLARGPMPLHEVNLDAALRAALEELDSEIQARRALVEVDGTLPRVRGHRTVLVQALINLVSNAVKFVESGVRPAVRIAARQHRDRVRICVADNGIGIDPRYTERIFRAFGRLHGQEAYPGTGLGLAMVKKAIERMGGRVGFASERERGSTFWLELPSGA
jgi:signal transduction histidine kinase